MSLGLADAFGIIFVPQFSILIIYAVMALVLVIRPNGLFGWAGDVQAFVTLRRNLPRAHPFYSPRCLS